MRTLAALLTVVLSTAAYAQADAPRAPSLQHRSCFGTAATRAEGTLINGNVSGGSVSGSGPGLPSGSTAAASSAEGPLSGGSVSGGGGGGEALLVLAVAVAVALPIIVYAVDSPADEETLFEYSCPRVGLSFTGGAVSTPSAPQAWSPLVGAKMLFTVGPVGFDASVESTVDPRFYGAMDAHFLLRPPPKQHIEGALALGVRRVVFGGAERNGFEVGLPHRYVLTRIGQRPLGLNVHPAVFIGQRGLDYRLEGGFTFPLGWTSLELGARVFSFDEHVRAGGYLALGMGG